MLKRLFVLCFILVAALYAEEYECAEGMLGYQVVIKGTKNLAPKVSSKTYRSAEYCEEDLRKYLSKHKRNSK